jgi:hypothetical protein
MIDVLDVEVFWQSMDLCYRKPATVLASNLCIIHLVLAIGSLLRGKTGDISSDDRSEPWQEAGEGQADRSYQAATQMLESMREPGQPDTWEVKALILCTVYRLILSRHNAAEESHGNVCGQS